MLPYSKFTLKPLELCKGWLSNDFTFPRQEVHSGMDSQPDSTTLEIITSSPLTSDSITKDSAYRYDRNQVQAAAPHGTLLTPID